MNYQFYIYILASQKRGTLYIGVTSNLESRTYTHKKDLIEGFTKRYGVHFLVYYETTNDINAAIRREKELKRYRRAWKIELIEQENPDWKDLSEGWR